MKATPAIRCLGLTKDYGKTRGVADLDLEVVAGEVFGFLGPNGAGKTTTIRLLMDFIRPTAGRAEVLGMDTFTESVEIRRRVGYLPGELSLYEGLTGKQLFAFFASIRGHVPLDHAMELCERLELDPSRPIEDLSKGNKQKVGLVQAFMHRPDLLILDEPTSGLDPLIQHEFHRMLADTAAEGRTVFLSSHVLSEVEHMANRVGIIRSGSLVAIEDVAALRSKAIRSLEFKFAGGVPAEDWSGIAGVVESHSIGNVAHFTVEGSVDPLLKAIARHEVVDVISHEPDLEETFLSYYSEPADG
ncbi:MAG TPA: ABC transporter ATP-binding protein [Actinomycetota bacterium]|nr:ABC transporter ATP-binding protein [Actinomycetota bacterium]